MQLAAAHRHSVVMAAWRWRPVLTALVLACAACQAAQHGATAAGTKAKALARPSPRPKPLPAASSTPGDDVSPPPSPRPAPFTWAPLSPAQQRRAEQLLSVFENSSLRPDYGYAEDLQDGRGVTFGRSGFCTGTGDGVLVLREYVRVKPRANLLARFLPILESIDQAGGGDSPLLAGPVKAQFIQAVNAASLDLLFRQAQDRLARQLYLDPSQRMAKELGLRLALSKAQLYDAYVQHGSADPDSSEWAVSVDGIVAWATRQAGGAPLQGADEQLWLQRFLQRRRAVLLGQGDNGWAEGVQRVDVYSWLLQMKDINLNWPLRLSWDRCRPDGKPGPCMPQPKRGELQIGGVVYGDFFLP